MTVNANTQIYDKAIDRAAMIRLYDRRLQGKVSVVLDGHEVRVDKLIREANLSTGGFTRLREAIDQELQRTHRDTFNVSSSSLMDLVSDQVSYAYQNLESTLGQIWRAERPPKRVSEDIVLQKPLIENRTLAQGWAGVSSSEKKRIESVIRKGIAEGRTLNEIAVDVRKGNVHSITRFQSRALVTTAITSVTAQADHEVYKANEKALEGWQYVATLDARTTLLCSHRDGHIYPISDTAHLPPAHFHCRSTTVPVTKGWSALGELEGVAQVRRANIKKLSDKEIAFYDGQTPMRETYNDWLKRQPEDVQIRHLGDYQKVELFRSGDLTVDQFTNPEGNSLGIRELRALTSAGYTLPGDTKRFAAAKQKLDAMQLWATTPDDLINNKDLKKTLADYYLLQAGELDGTLSVTNYRGALLGTKKSMRQRVLTSPPSEEQLKFNPITGRYEDIRLYQPNIAVLNNNLRLVKESERLLDKDKEFITDFIDSLDEKMSVNERAVITDNLRIIFGRYRENKEIWGNFKAVVQSQIKFDVMNVSDYIETQIRKDQDVLKRLLQSNYLDPVLGPVQLDDLHENFLNNIRAKNAWEDFTAPKIANELRNVFDYKIPVLLKQRISDSELQQFYLRFAHRLSLADTPDRDQFAVALGRDLYNMANLNGDRKKWYTLGMSLLEAKNVKKFFEVETFGVQKRRMKSKMSGTYFGPYYDTLAFNIRVTDKRVQDYAQLTRKVDLGLRVSVTEDKNRLVFREGFKTYFIDRGILGYEDTRIPITSTSSFSDFPAEFVDKNMADALNWAAQSKYKIDEDYFDFVQKLLYFEDDKGKAKFYNELNEYRKFIAARGDAYERFKSMEWLRKSGKAFSNHPFVDHRARIYDRGLISPQSGETFRPFLNTAELRNFSADGFENLQDQVGAFLGGLNDFLEGRYNSLTITGRQKIAERWRPEIVKIGNHMLRGKPNDIRAILESELVSKVDGEEQGKFFRFAMEMAKIDNYLGGNYSKKNLEKLSDYKIALALEQDASSSGAQIIALTTRNKQLAELSNVIPTTQKKRLYDEIAAATYNDPRFKVINEKLGLTEKDLRKAAKAQNMVTFYGAGERTGILNVEGKLGKVLGKDTNTLVVKAADRDIVLNEISARVARYERFDPETAEELRQLRQNVRDVFNKGLDPGDDILEQLYFLEPKTKDLVEKLSHSYEKVITPDDFKSIAKIMSEQLAEQVPILKDFTKFFGRLAEDYLVNAKPSDADFDWKTIAKIALRGSKKKGYVLPDYISKTLGLKPGEPVSEKILKRFGFWKPNGNLSDIIYGVDSPETRRTGAKYLKVELTVPTVDLKNAALGKEVTLNELELFYANKLPKSWTNVPWVNFDGKVIEQNFTQQFEERLRYKDKDGNWVNNILQVPQKTEASWWDQAINKSGKINDIADATKARTAFAVNGNHSNDAVIVKRFHLWGKKAGISTSTIHDAFFANAADMLQARQALREIYGKTLEKNVIKNTLEEMRSRGLPQELYDKYLEEAIDLGLIPVAGKSRVGGKIITEKDILELDDILKEVPKGFKTDYGWYGVG
jgi:SPP1 gp7 family putative phage head morphogenesis protein